MFYSSENEFQLEFGLKNLHDSQAVHVDFTSNSSLNPCNKTINPKSEVKLIAILSKFNFEALESNENISELCFSKILNNRLKFNVLYEKKTAAVNIDFNLKNISLLKYKNILFQMPINILWIEKTFRNSQVFNIHFGFKLKKFSVKYQEFSFELCKKIRYCLMQNNYKKTFKVYYITALIAINFLKNFRTCQTMCCIWKI